MDEQCPPILGCRVPGSWRGSAVPGLVVVIPGLVRVVQGGIPTEGSGFTSTMEFNLKFFALQCLVGVVKSLASDQDQGEAAEAGEDGDGGENAGEVEEHEGDGENEEGVGEDWLERGEKAFAECDVFTNWRAELEVLRTKSVDELVSGVTGLEGALAGAEGTGKVLRKLIM